jgi:hypothetical protein
LGLSDRRISFQERGGAAMDKVYICEECTNEIPFTDEDPGQCQCGADKENWMVAEKPERRCGGESK